MRSLVIATVLSSLAFACSGPADDAADESTSAESALTAQPRSSQVRYRGTLDVEGAPYAIEVSVSHPEALATTQTIRGSQIMSDSPNCDAYLESFRGDVALRILGPDGDVLAENRARAYFNTHVLLDDAACPQGLLVSRAPIQTLGIEAEIGGVSFAAGARTISVPFGYGGNGILSLSGSASFEATGRGIFSGKRESDRGSSTVTTKGIARFELASSVRVPVGLTFLDVTDVTLDRVD